jgi:glycosyltransferase involved in cell wall biosynthesis
MKILFVHNTLQSFVRYDLQTLRSVHDVRELKFAPSTRHLRDVVQAVSWCDLVFGWWASWHMLTPAIMARRQGKGVIVAGGDYDIIYDPFGRSRGRLLRDRPRQMLGRFLFPCIDRFIVHSDYEAAQARQVPYIRHQQLVRIYHGLPDLAAGWPLKKANIVLTVGTVNCYEIVRKGLGTFVKAAALLPQYDFKLVGKWQDRSVDMLRSWNNRNVAYLGFVPDAQLFETMSRANVYVQVSYREGFGMALAEAMLFQCAPVVTKHGSIPEVVGDWGIYVPYDDPVSTAAAIQEACQRSNELGPLARHRVLSLFPLDERKRQLLKLTETVYAQHCRS